MAAEPGADARGPVTPDGPVAGPRSAAVLGHPVEHSLSPVLHDAAYRALGLDGWTYGRLDCPEGALAGLVDASPAERVGYSVTMPGKPEALAYSDTVSERARLVGSANTLVRRAGGWHADCTDVDGAVGALGAFGDLPAEPVAVVFGVGGTARPVLAGLAARGARSVTLASRRDTAAVTARCGRDLGLEVRTLLFDDPDLPALVAAADVLVNTVPEPGVRGLVPLAAGARRVFDVLYDPWPTALGAAAARRGVPVVGGDVMLLEQALGQVELFTGRPAPREAMASALAAALGR